MTWIGIGNTIGRRGGVILSLSLLGKMQFLWTGAFEGDNLKNDLGSDVIAVTGKDFATSYIPATSAATFQVPNNPTYIAVDTDYIWFKTNESQRSVTVAELIGYDLQRTPVKYDDDSPHHIRAFAILKSGAVLTASERDQLFRFFMLPVLWDNNLNPYGHIKANRVGQNLWVPEVPASRPAIVLDGNTLFWNEFDDTDHITTVDGKVSNWASIDPTIVGYFGQGIVEARPTIDADSILFDETNTQYLLSQNDMSISQDLAMYMVIKPLSNTKYLRYIGGYNNDGYMISQMDVAGNTNIHELNYMPTNLLPLNEWSVLMLQYSQSGRKVYRNGVQFMDDNTAALKNSIVTGFKLASRYTNVQHANFRIRAIGVRHIWEGADDWTAIYNYLNSKYNY